MSRGLITIILLAVLAVGVYFASQASNTGQEQAGNTSSSPGSEQDVTYSTELAEETSGAGRNGSCVSSGKSH